MQRSLSAEEVEAMVRAARNPKGGAPPEQRSVKPCSFRQAGQLTRDQLRAINALHEGFGRSLTQSLGAYLRVSFEATLLSVEQLAYFEFLERVPEITYVTAFRIPQMNASGAVQIDNSLVFPVVDVLLGGTGTCEAMTREISEIEEQIMEGVVRIICGELELAWVPLGVQVELGARQPLAQIKRFFPLNERTLCLGFEIKMAEVQGTLNLVLPISVSNTLLRKLATDWQHAKSGAPREPSQQLAAKLLDCAFPLALAVPKVKVPVEELLSLFPGRICNLGVPVRVPAALTVAGRELFEANPVRHGRQRAAHVGQAIQTKEERTM